MSTATKLLTVEEYEKIPNPPGGVYELHHGELVFVTYPTQAHKNIQWRLRNLLAPAARRYGIIETEFPFRPEPEYEMRGADVAFVSKRRMDMINPDGWLIGAPELVIEVLSPSNTTAEMKSKCALCLANGSIQFWTVDPKKKQVRVFRRDGSSQLYIAGQPVPLTEIFSEGQLAVDDIFSSAVS